MGQNTSVEDARKQVADFKSSVPKEIENLTNQYLRDNPCQLWSDDGKLCRPFHFPVFPDVPDGPGRPTAASNKYCGYFCNSICQKKFHDLFEHASKTGHDWPFYATFMHPLFKDPLELSIKQMNVSTFHSPTSRLVGTQLQKRFNIDYSSDYPYLQPPTEEEELLNFLNVCENFSTANHCQIIFYFDYGNDIGEVKGESENKLKLDELIKENLELQVVGLADTRIGPKRKLPRDFFGSFGLFSAVMFKPTKSKFHIQMQIDLYPDASVIKYLLSYETSQLY